MNSWMTEERKEIARQYVYDMINSFVEDPHTGNYHDEYNPPYVSFYSPDLERLLVKACYDDKYTVKHGEVGGLAEFHDFNNNIYDIDGHRVWTLGGGTVLIDIDGVAFDQFEMDRLMSYARKTNKVNKGRLRRPGEATLPSNRFHVRLPTKPK